MLDLGEAWTATLAFTFQLFCDFSAYTEMAIGIALLFGLLLPENFRRPYVSTSVREFWRRWHISLSNFIRDYLYIPLGGSRHGVPRLRVRHHGRHGHLRTVARRRLDLRGLGPVARLRPARLPRLAEPEAADAGARGLGDDDAVRDGGLGAVPRRRFLTPRPRSSTAWSAAGGFAGASRATRHLIGVAALVSVLVPSAHEIKDMRPLPYPAIAVTAAALAGFCVLEVGNGSAAQFHLFPVLRRDEVASVEISWGTTKRSIGRRLPGAALC